jgi:hypothetical protein
LARRESAGITSATIPLTQMDLADAAALSVVHVNRTFQELRKLNILSKEGRTIEVVDRERLVRLAGFDGNYLNMPQLLSHGHVKMEHTSTPDRRSPELSPFSSATRLASLQLEARLAGRSRLIDALHKA